MITKHRLNAITYQSQVPTHLSDFLPYELQHQHLWELGDVCLARMSCSLTTPLAEWIVAMIHFLSGEIMSQGFLESASNRQGNVIHLFLFHPRLIALHTCSLKNLKGTLDKLIKWNEILTYFHI